MSMRDLREGLELVRAHEELADFEGPRPLELIESAELALGLSFPATYKAFLAELACGDIAGEEFFGIVNNDFENSSVPDAIWVTLDERRVSGLPKALVIIYDLGDGTYYALDTSQTKEEECPIVAWTPSLPDNKELEIIAKDFGAFFLDIVKEALQSS